MRSARQTNAIVSSLFPENVRSRLFRDNADEIDATDLMGGKASAIETQEAAGSSDPIADLL